MCTILRTTRVTPAMAAGVTDRVWTLEEFHDAITAETAPVEKPKAQPFTHRTPPGPARELPAGRGFLQLVKGGGDGGAPVPTPPAAGARVAPSVPPVREVPRRREQLDLFGEPIPGERMPEEGDRPEPK